MDREKDTDYHPTSNLVPEKPELVEGKQEIHSLPSLEASAHPAEPLPNPDHGYSAAQGYHPAPSYFSAHGYPPAVYSTQGYYVGHEPTTENRNIQDGRPHFNPTAAYTAQNPALQANQRPLLPQDFLQRTSCNQATLLLDTESQVTIPPIFLPESENQRTRFVVNLRPGQQKLVDEEKGLPWGLHQKAQERDKLPCRAETDPVFTQRQPNVETLNFLSSKRAVPEDDGKDVIILTVKADETEWEQDSDELRAYQWRHMDSQQLSFNAFELTALRLPGLHGDDIAVVRQLLGRVWQTYGRQYGHGSYLESGIMCCDSNSVLRGDAKKKKTATFFCLPYFSIDEPQAGTNRSVDETSLHPIRTLLQYRYRSFPTPERDFQKWQPCKEKVLRVPQIWGLIINSTYIVTAAPQSLVELQGKHIQLNKLLQLSQSKEPSLIQFFDGTGHCHYFPVQKCRTWSEIMNAVESTMPRASTAQELRIRRFLLMGSPVTDKTWSSSLQAETSTVVSLRMTYVYPQHQTGIYNTRTGYHERPMETKGPTARRVINANESLSSGLRKPKRQRNTASQDVLNLAEEKHAFAKHGKEKQEGKDKENKIKNPEGKNAKKAALKETNSPLPEIAFFSDDVWATDLRHLFSDDDVPPVIVPERRQGSDMSTPDDPSLHSKEGPGGRNLFAELKMESAPEGNSVRDSSSQSEEELVDSALITRFEPKSASREFVVEEWLLYPDMRLDDLQAQSWAMQQPVGPPTWKNDDDTHLATTSLSTDEYMFPVFTWLCGVRTSKAKEDSQSSQATNGRTLGNTLDILHMDMSRSTYAQKGWGNLEQVEGDVYNDLAERTQTETEALGFHLRNSAGFQEKYVILKRAKRLSNFFIPNNWTCEVSNKYWGAVFKIMTSADIPEGHPLLNQCSSLLKCLLRVADDIQYGINAHESPQVPSNIRLAFSKAYRSIVMLFINVSSLRAPDRTHELELQRAGTECLQLMEKGKYHLVEMAHLDNSTESFTSEAVNVEAVIALIVDRSIEGFSALDNSLLDLYANHIERLELQVRGNPKRRLLRDINTTIEELETITTILARQGKTLNDFLQLLRSDVRPHSPNAQRLDISTVEQTMRKDWNRLEEAKELQKRASGLVYQLRQSLEILNDDHGKAILVFTVVTIIFLPLSFVTSFLGMNTSDIRNQTSGQGLFWTIAIPLAVFVTLIALGLAFREQIGQGFEDLLASVRKTKRS